MKSKMGRGRKGGREGWGEREIKGDKRNKIVI